MNDDDWDKLIIEALAVRTTPEQERRLERSWRELIGVRTRRRRAFAALAACLCLLAVGSWIVAHRAATSVPSPALVATAESNSAAPPLSAPASEVPAASSALHSIGRPATVYEQAMVSIGRVRAARAAESALSQRVADDMIRLEKRVGLRGLPEAALATTDPSLRRKILSRLLEANDGTSLRGYLALVAEARLRAEALAVVREAEQPPIDALLELLKSDDKSTRTSAAVVLGCLNGPRITSSLIELITKDPRAPAEAWIALVACRGDSADEFLAYAAHESSMIGRLNRAHLFWKAIQ